MKRIVIFVFVLCFFTGGVQADNVGRILAKTKVNHLELLASNLNMLYVVGKTIEGNGLKNGGKESGLHKDVGASYMKVFSVSKDDRLIISDYHKVPVADVTDKKCMELRDKLRNEITDEDTILAIIMLSVPRLSEEQALSLLKDAYTVVYVQARENPRLSISCQ